MSGGWRGSGRAVLSLAFLLLGCEPAAEWITTRTEFPVRVRSSVVAPLDPAPTRLKVMTWNVKYAGGRINFWFDLWGDRTEMKLSEVLSNMDGIYRLINEVQPDVLVVNEIEVDSRRSAYFDMVGGILENTDLNYAAYVPNWNSRWVPSDGVGRVQMGNAVFSRYPITRNEGIPQSDRTDQDFIHDIYYLHRTIVRAELDVGLGSQVVVYGVHTEAYDQDGTKSRQLVEIDDLLQAETMTWMVAGDFNALPPTSVKIDDFNDEHPSAIGTDFESPPYVLPDTQRFYDKYVPAITLTQYGATELQQRRYYTHSVIGPATIGSNGDPGFWTRTLDYLFVEAPSFWVPGTSDVLQKPGDSGIASNPLYLSDHCPVIGTWEYVR